MLKYLPIILLLGLSFILQAQSPHGADFKMNCSACHTSDSWEIPANAWDFRNPEKPNVSKTTGWVIKTDSLRFNHYDTKFPLEGQHITVDCRSCHETLVFSEAQTECISCHTDMHQLTVGSDCARCHSTENWLVDNITELHQDNGFPLLGAHAVVSCNECHISASQLQFNRVGNDCVNCHLADYNSTTNPNHPEAGFSIECSECHSIDVMDWSTDEVNHDFFPLTKGHDISDCASCHIGGNYSNTPTECVACHQPDYNNTQNPNHQGTNFSTSCTECHTTDVGWVPAVYGQHDADYFPIYSGAHNGEWNECVDCHTNAPDFAQFSCTNCHTNPQTNDEHDEVNGYAYNDHACLACHPTGNAEDNFDHNQTSFPLMGAHATVDCISCHANGFEGTPTNCAACHIEDFNQTTNPDHETLQFPIDCESCHTEEAWVPTTFDHNAIYPFTGAHISIANECALCHNGDYNNTPNTCAGCHTEDYNQSINPNHTTLNFPIECESCHTTEPDWIPASFDIHDNYYVLNGAHAMIANDCAACHNGDYNNTPNTCFECHEQDYSNTVDPNHTVLQFSTDCQSCHTENEWVPATFDHDGQYFPIYSGAHEGEWSDCIDCHTNLSNYAEVSCTACHLNPQTDNDHVGVNGYSYNSPACLACHPTGSANDNFDHNQTGFPLTGAHITTDCISCHANGFPGTPTECSACHIPEFNQTSNPNHVSLGLPSNCESCHTTEPGWSPASFDIHNDFYVLNGAHSVISYDCATCHNGDYNNTPNTCSGCHTLDFNQTTNPDHQASQFPIDCESCHTETAWVPSTFDHNNYYPLTGAHDVISDDCVICHNGNYSNTPNTCAGCHIQDYEQSVNPNHTVLNLPTDCENCHTTAPDWMPANFDIHDDFYVLNGAHALISNDCAACHNGDYNNTPNTCYGCHEQDYSNTTNPNHTVLQFSTDCQTCHTENEWIPSTFDHDMQYFPIYSGTHDGEWSECIDCHTNPTNYSEFSCTTCHTNPETDDAHNGVNGYTYNNPACLACHPTGSAMDNFDHNLTGFPLTGAHLNADCISCHVNGFPGTPTECSACHTPDFNQTSNPNHVALGLPTDCENCHTTEPGWSPATFDIHDSYYVLDGAHTPISNDCATCHNGDYNNTPNTCDGCHMPDYNQSTNPNHTALAFPTNCESCHTTEPDWMPATFDIHDNYYVLNGAHAVIANDCVLCHNGDYNNTPNTCFGCHENDYNQTTNPDHVVAQFPTDCESCHTEDAWVPSTFDHNAIYPLTGAHQAIENDCISCHSNGYPGTPNTCEGCHTEDYNQSTNPNHSVLNLPMDCESCHTTEPDWMPATFPIHDNYYVLNGAHAAIANDCVLCHNGNYNNTPNTCFGCHENDYNQTTNPDHAAAQFPTDCENCHTDDAWIPSTFDHNNYYPLTGAHQTIENDCNACHSNGYPGTPNTCEGCHTEDYNQSTNPNHSVLNLPMDCESCHTTDPDWMPATFDIHDNYYVLNGAHAAIANDCVLCHNGDYNNTPNTCFGCHENDYNQTTNPDHMAAQLPTDCESCHNEDAWVPSTFDHNNYYPLTGAHQIIENECLACHSNGYPGTPNTCEACHTDDYNQSTNPNHSVLGLPMDCESCHTTEPDWMPATFDIHNNYYVLNGAHAAIANDCVLCHNGDYNNTPNTCFGCHENDYNQTTNPDHVAAQLPTDCESCHTEDAWIPSTFDHNNYYPLTGAHQIIENDCIACHSNGYPGTPNTCEACHTEDYNQSTNPNHSVLSLSMDCENCHTTEPDWMPATFDIHNNYYQLNGAHAAIANDCVVCHNGDYNNTPNTCFGCHEDDYNGATNPNHLNAGFPTTCEDCHTEDTWIPSTFDHDAMYFPIYSGKHDEEWNECIDCHTIPGNFGVFSCIDCHEHDDPADMLDKHEGVNGYEYSSPACFACHPTGEKD